MELVEIAIKGEKIITLLIAGIIIFIGLMFYFIWTEVKSRVFPRPGYECKETVNLDDVKFTKEILPYRSLK